MQKRILAVVLCLCMALAILPMGAAATPANEVEPGFYYLYTTGDGNGNWIGDSGSVYKQEPVTPNSSFVIQLVYVSPADNSIVPVSAEDVSFPTGVSVEYPILNDNGTQADPSFVRLSFQELGEYAITYTAAGSNNAISFYVFLPDYAFYTSPTASARSYIDMWEYDGTDPDCYFILNYQDADIYDFHLLSDVYQVLPDTVTTTITKISKTCYEIQMTDYEPHWTDEFVQFSYSYTLDGSDNPDCSAGILFRDVRPSLQCRIAGWDPDTQTYYSDPTQQLISDDMLNDSYWSPCDEPVVEFFYEDESGNEVTLPFSKLEFDGDCCTATPEGDFVRLFFDKLGECCVRYPGLRRHRFNSILARVGFYSKPEVSETNLLTTWEYSDTNDTIYLAAMEHLTIADIVVKNGPVAEVTVSPDSTFAAIRLTDPSISKLFLSCKVIFEDNAGSYTTHLGINVKSEVQPRLGWQYCRWNDTAQAWEFEPAWEPTYGDNTTFPGNTTCVQFFYDDGSGAPIPVPFDSLQFEGSSVTPSPAGDYVLLNASDFGSCTVSYQGAALTIQSTLPTAGFYSKPEATQSNFLKEWKYSADNDTVYLMTQENYTLSDVVLDSGDPVEITLSDDGTCAAVKLADPSLLYVSLRYRLTYTYPDPSFPFTFTFDSVSNITILCDQLVWRFTDWDDAAGTWVSDPSQELVNHDFAWFSPGNSAVVEFLVDTGDGDPVSVSAGDLVFDGNGVAATAEGDFIRFDFLDFGQITASYDGMKRTILSSLPYAGFYSAPKASEENYLYYIWNYSESNDTVYLATINGYTLSDLKQESGDPAEITLSDDGTYAAVRLADCTQDSLSISFHLDMGFWSFDSNAIIYLRKEQEEPDGPVVPVQPSMPGPAAPAVPAMPSEFTVPELTTVTRTDEFDSITTETFDRSGNMVGASVEISLDAAKAAEGAPLVLDVDMKPNGNSPLLIAVPEEAGTLQVEIPVEGVSPTSVVVLVHEDGTEEILPKAALTENGLVIEASGSFTVKIEDNSKKFADVSSDFWGKDAIDFVAARELFVGVEEDEFAPDLTMTRAMIVTVLYRMEGKPESDAMADFKDIAADKWYSDAVAWASENGIVQGYGDTFGKDDPVTREQLVLMLYRMAGQPETEAVETGASDWAAKAMSWAVSIGLIQGDGSGYNAQGTATRAETATMLMRFINL